MDRQLDGVFFRIKRDDTFQNICFSDLTEEEQDDVMKEKDAEWLRSLCKILAKTIHEIGDQFDICCGYDD